MDVEALIKAYNSLPAVEQSMVAAVVRAHQVFNQPEWRSELARRHEQIDRGAGVGVETVERVIQQLEARTA